MTKKTELLIFPYNGNGLEAIDCIGNEFEFVGFVDDTPEKLGITSDGYKVFSRDVFKKYPNAQVLAVPGSPSSYLNRRHIIEKLDLELARFACVIHPFAHVSALAQMGNNVLIMAGVVITSNAKIGSHTCILPNTVIHHDVVIGEWSLIGSNVTIAGSTRVEENCYIGSGSSIMNGLHIGRGSLIGMGSNVIRNVQENQCMVGNPARSLEKWKM